MSVAVPVGADHAFSYRVDAGPIPVPGTRVLVPFGQRVLLGVVRPVQAEVPEGTKLRTLLESLDPVGQPSLPPDVVDLCEWIGRYYLAPLGEIYRLALPGLLSQADARRAWITDSGCNALERAEQGPLWSGGVGSELAADERRVLAALISAGERGMPVSALSGLRPRLRCVGALIDKLAGYGLFRLGWDPALSPKSRVEKHVRRTDYLAGPSTDEQRIRALVGRSKQRRGLLDYIDGQGEQWVSVSELRGPFPRLRQLLPPLIDAGLVSLVERPRAVDPFDTAVVEASLPQTPTEEQAKALDELIIAAQKRTFFSALLHGITGCGKTEVYLQLIEHVRRDGGGAIVLVPEISLTPQLSDRFRSRFGDTVAVLHSGLTPRQRHDAWQQIRSGERRIVIGARSAVFAPVPDLRVVVVDEEHDGSFKQEDGVRYHARDVALVRAQLCSCVAVLGSATPSLESYQLARDGKHRWLQIKTRPTPRPLPEVEIVDLRVHRPDSSTMLTARLSDAVRAAVRSGEQVILFLNRRGYTTGLVCLTCGAQPQCPDCSAPSMTYHLKRNRLLCHLCGYLEATPEACTSCGAGKLVHTGAGTERVELALAQQFADLRVLRLDRDTTRGRKLIETLRRFRAREADVLVGTQMLAKGHDFPGVTLVGIVSADQGLSLPDPRASERCFQLLTQVAGRAGRGRRAGRVILQAYGVGHPAIQFAAEHDYEGFAARELKERKQLGNPPFGHLALVRFVGNDAQAVERIATGVAQQIRMRAEVESGAVRVLGPVASPIERINRRTRWQVLLRAPQRLPLHRMLHFVRGAASLQRSVQVTLDIDPQSLL
ncbi:MAG: primosomal protein N' [Nannocystaceae bacterium]